MLFVRENTEGEYAGVGGRAHRGLASEVGIETSVFTRGGVERVIRLAFELAEGRRGVVTSATKSNASRYGYVLWDEVAEEVAAEHPSDYYAHESLGNIYLEMGDLVHAESEYSRAYELSPPQYLQEKLKAVRQRRQHEESTRPRPAPRRRCRQPGPA